MLMYLARRKSSHSLISLVVIGRIVNTVVWVLPIVLVMIDELACACSLVNLLVQEIQRAKSVVLFLGKTWLDVDQLTRISVLRVLLFSSQRILERLGSVLNDR